MIPASIATGALLGFASINFLHFAALLFVVCAAVLMLVSLALVCGLSLAAAGLDWKPGDKVAIWANNVPEWVYTQYGSARMGAVLVTAILLVFLRTGRVPARGEMVPHESGIEFEVVDADPRRIKKVRISLSKAALKRKIALLMRVFKTQHNKQWFTPDTFQGLMRLRGIECNSPSGFAEAFYSRKLLLGGGE